MVGIEPHRLFTFFVTIFLLSTMVVRRAVNSYYPGSSPGAGANLLNERVSMPESRLVSPEVAQQIAKEVREDFQAALEYTTRLGNELDELSRREARKSSPSSLRTVIRAAIKKLFG